MKNYKITKNFDFFFLTVVKMDKEEQAQEIVQTSTPNKISADEPPQQFTKLQPLPTPDSKLTPAEKKKIAKDIAFERHRSKMLKRRPFSRADSLHYQSWFSDSPSHRFPLSAPRRPPVFSSGGRPFNPITVVHQPKKLPKTKRQIIAEMVKKHL